MLRSLLKLCYFVSFLEPPSIGPFAFAADIVDEGSFAQITCSVTKGDEPLKITWHLHGDDISSEPSITTTMIGTRTSILIISQVGYRHSGLYTCRASNPAGSATHSTELKVNGNSIKGEPSLGGEGGHRWRHWQCGD